MKMLRLKQVMEKTGLGRTSIYELGKTGKFPEKVKLGARAVSWVEDEVNKWLEERVAASRKTGSKEAA